MVLELSAKLLASITWLKGTRRNSGPPRKRKLAVLRWRSTTATSGTTSVFGPSPIRIRQAASNYYPLHLHSGYCVVQLQFPSSFCCSCFAIRPLGCPFPRHILIPYVQSYITNRMGPEFPCREQILTPLACSGSDTNI